MIICRAVFPEILVSIPALEFKQEYRPADEIDLSSWCEEAIETDPYLWYLKNSVDDADFKLQTYEYNVLEEKATN